MVCFVFVFFSMDLWSINEIICKPFQESHEFVSNTLVSQMRTKQYIFHLLYVNTNVHLIHVQYQKTKPKSRSLDLHCVREKGFDHRHSLNYNFKIPICFFYFSKQLLLKIIVINWRFVPNAYKQYLLWSVLNPCKD